MPRNGSGTYNLVNNTWYPPVNGVLATSTDWNTFISDVGSALTQSVSSDGQTPMTGNLPMGGNKITGLAAGTANTDAINFTQQTGRLLNVQIFAASGTYTPTAGTTRIIVEVVGAGGAGGGAVFTGAGTLSAGSGGGAGGFSKSFLTSGFTPTVAVTVGAGGAGVNGANGNAGGNTSFGAFITMPGGGGGNVTAAAAIAGAGGGQGSLGTGGNIVNQRGNSGDPSVAAFAATYLQSGAGGTSIYGGLAPSAFNFTGGGAAATNGSNSSASGSGGSGGTSTSGGGTTVGGAGSSGLITVYEYS